MLWEISGSNDINHFLTILAIECFYIVMAEMFLHLLIILQSSRVSKLDKEERNEDSSFHFVLRYLFLLTMHVLDHGALHDP